MSRALWHVPEAWVWASLGQVLSIDSNLVDPANYKDHPHIAPNHIESGTGHLLPYTTIAADKVTSPKHLFFPGQILYSKIRPYLAKAVRVDFEGLCSADMYPLSSRVHAGYLWRWLLTPSFTESASKCQGRTVLPKINQEALVQLAIPVPPLREQEQISNQIERLFDRSRRVNVSLTAVPALLNQLRQATLAAAFRGALTAAWRAKHPAVEPADKLLARIRAERVRTASQPRGHKVESVEQEMWSTLPNAWAVGRLEEFVTYLDQGWSPQCDSVPREREDEWAVIRTTAVQPAQFIPDENKRLPTSLSAKPETEIQAGDLLITRAGPRSRAGVCCRVENVPPRLMACDKVYRFRVEESVLLGEYLELFLNSPQALASIEGMKTGISDSGVNLTQGKFLALHIPVAPIAEQQQVIRSVRAVLEACNRLQQHNRALSERLSTLESGVLAKAFRGELVPQDPNDEPASILLERLRAEAAVEPVRKAARRSLKVDPKQATPTKPSIGTTPESEKPTRCHRPPANGTAMLAAVNPPQHPESTPARPAELVAEPPTRPAEQAVLAFPSDATPFIDLPADAQAEQVQAVLLGEGLLPREDAIRRAAEILRDQGRAQFQRLRGDGPLATAIDHAISLAIRQDRIDRPQRGSVRALARTPGDVPPALWRRAIVAAQAATPNADPDTLVRAAATWLQSQIGLEFQRLRSGGHIDTALRQALNATSTRA